jgi:carbohydrate kinase (thermoresistant glucokinase family)
MVIVVMGVTGSGKTTVGTALASALEWPYFDADDFHPPSNVAKMASGVPLTDADRAPWLAALRARIEEIQTGGSHAVFSCSALKASYRETLAAGDPDVRFVHLHGSEALLAERLRHRIGHFMNPELLDSQLATLEPPAGAITVDIALPLGAQVEAIRKGFGV